MSEPHLTEFPDSRPATAPPDAAHCASSVTMATLKRPASPSFENDDQPKRKRVREHADETAMVERDAAVCSKSKLAGELAFELQCGCCSELVYNPVVVLPCQHFFCGSCCVLWIRNGGTNCPACRGISTAVNPFRALQTVVDTLLRSAPELARTERERQQADDVYRPGLSLRIPSPKEPSPEPNLNANLDLAQPCPHCIAGNIHGWRCPQPIPDPVADPEHAWHLDEGAPPGHGNCGHCENLLAIEAPVTSKCDLCQVLFCGINIRERCRALPLDSQHPQGLSSVGDLIESPDVYDCFDNNQYEVEIMFDYLRTLNKKPRQIYCDIISYVHTQPRGLQPLIESDVFSDINGNGADGVPQGPYNRICRVCAAEVLLWGLKEWWIRERQVHKDKLDAAVLTRPDCPGGNGCQRQKELTHARDFNHIIAPLPLPETQVSQANIGAIPIATLGSNDSVPLIPSSSIDAVENMITATPPQHQQRPSALSFLLNGPELDDTGVFGRAIARRMRSPSPDLRDAIDALSP
ncbi:hypothetical protein FA15DRAFT_103867 [Coprinopsis marcescibilis]|uniref:RING-type domain-containing protein n=1 Tax=Coprinopsis marcescibilis TaxID=230819 RepID=A0A5C3L5D7_COPMA|nr:hypothetical protein FA15DRAFT_103867 [Coprinopsis marcescibilis]